MSGSVQSMSPLFGAVDFIIPIFWRLMQLRGEVPYPLLSNKAKMHTQVNLQHHSSTLFNLMVLPMYLFRNWVIYVITIMECKVSHIGNKVRCNKTLLLAFIFENWPNMSIFQLRLWKLVVIICFHYKKAVTKVYFANCKTVRSELRLQFWLYHLLMCCVSLDIFFLFFFLVV